MAPNPILDRGLDWLSRTIAVLVVMVGPGLLGSFADHRLGTSFWTPTGLVLGTLLGTYLLLLLARKLTPPARGKPIPFDDEEEDGDQAERDQDRSQSSGI